MAEIEWAAWNDQVVPELERMKNEFLPAGTVYDDPNQRCPESDRADDTRSSTPDCSRPRADTVELTKEQLVTWFLGSHEYLLQCIEAWAAADRRALRRSTRCSTSSGRSGATRCCRA